MKNASRLNPSALSFPLFTEAFYLVLSILKALSQHQSVCIHIITLARFFVHNELRKNSEHLEIMLSYLPMKKRLHNMDQDRKMFGQCNGRIHRVAQDSCPEKVRLSLNYGFCAASLHLNPESWRDGNSNVHQTNQN